MDLCDFCLCNASLLFASLAYFGFAMISHFVLLSLQFRLFLQTPIQRVFKQTVRFSGAACYICALAFALAAQNSLLAAQSTKSPQKKRSSASFVEVISFARLQEYMRHNPDTVRVINFWATTCPPCVEEMPDFDRLHRELRVGAPGRKPVHVVFVSLDFKRDLEKKVLPFVKKKGFVATAVFLGPPKSAEIDAIDESWSGAMPATLIVGTKSGNRSFYEKKMTYLELKDFVMKYCIP